jgi:hypothetical protein
MIRQLILFRRFQEIKEQPSLFMATTAIVSLFFGVSLAVGKGLDERRSQV